MNFGIIGAGLTGLTAGYELSKKGHKVTIFEKENSVGGLCASFSINNEPLEMFYHHIFSNDKDILAFLEELGLDTALKWYVPRNAIYINGKIHPFTTPIDLLRFKELKIYERMLLGLLIFKSRFLKDWHSLDKITAKEWIIRNAGKNVYKKIWEPLLVSKFDKDAQKISGTWIWNKFKLRGTSRGTDISKEVLGYLDKSFIQVALKLKSKIEQTGGKIHLNSEINNIIPIDSGKLELVSNSKTYTFDKVIVTSPPGLLLDMNIPLNKEEHSKISQILYKGNICMVMETKKKVSDYYWLTVADPNIPFVLVIEHTNLITDKRYSNSIIYLSRYIDVNDPLFSLDNDKLVKLFISGFKKIYPMWHEKDCLSTHIFKSAYAQPVVKTGYLEILPPHTLSIPNLYLASMPQIYPEDRGQNYAVRLGKKVVDIALSDNFLNK